MSLYFKKQYIKSRETAPLVEHYAGFSFSIVTCLCREYAFVMFRVVRTQVSQSSCCGGPFIGVWRCSEAWVPGLQLHSVRFPDGLGLCLHKPAAG